MRSLAIAVLGTALALAAEAAPAQKSGVRAASLTGLVDERPGAIYVLRREPTMEVIAVLRPSGFANESFAKHLGHRVRVRGRLNRAGAEPVMSVARVVPLHAAPTGEAARAENPSALGDVPAQALTGWVNRQGRGYVLRDPLTRSVLARLSPGPGGAGQLRNYVGQKVLVEGRIRQGEPRPVMEVERVESFR